MQASFIGSGKGLFLRYFGAHEQHKRAAHTGRVHGPGRAGLIDPKRKGGERERKERRGELR